MATLEALKKATIELRKARSPLAPFAVFVLAEVQKIGKNAGNRDTTEAEAIQVLKKVLATSEDNYSAAVEVNAGSETIQNYIDEGEFIRDLLPQMVDEETVRNFLNSTFSGQTPNKGQVMKALKEKFGAYVDMKAAGAIFTEMYAS
jgi:uncharacterized protein YqeY